MHKSEQINELAAALVKVQSQLHAVKKDSKNPFFKSDYASYEADIEVARPLLTANGLALIHIPTVVEGHQGLTILLMHVSGQWLSGTYLLNPIKNDPQAVGSATTYYKRYSFEAMVGLVTTDDDGEAAMSRDKDKKRKEENNRIAQKFGLDKVHPEAGTAKTLTPASSVLELSGFTVKVGKEHLGRNLGDVPLSDIKRALEFYGGLKRPLSPEEREFLLLGQAYVDKLKEGTAKANG